MKYFSLFWLVGCTTVAVAQTPAVPDTLTGCGVTTSFMEKNIDPQLLQTMNAQWQAYSKQNKATGRLSADDPVLVVPVMFHIAHKGEGVGSGSNVSEGQIQTALATLNNAFRARGKFASGNDTRIEFVLANCSGIDRADASGVPNFLSQGVIVSDGNQQQQVKALFGTYSDKFVNVYVCPTITGAGGFANFGGDMFIPVYIFSKSGSNYSTSQTFAHEMGHSLFLNHTFAGDNSCIGCSFDNVVCPINDNPTFNGDQVADTPPHRVFDVGYNSSPAAINTCTGEPFGIGLVKNHMAYYNNPDRFTPGQIARMRFYLENYLTKWLNSDAIPTPNDQLSLSSVPSLVCANSSVAMGYSNNSGSGNPVFLIQKGDDVVQYVEVADGLANFTFPVNYFNVSNYGVNLPSGNDYSIRLVAGCNSKSSAAIQYSNVSTYQASVVGADGQPLPNINTLTDGSINLCNSSSLTLKARLTYTQNGSQYMVPESELSGLNFQWTLNGGNLPSATGSSYALSGTSGTYRYTLTAPGCVSQSAASYGVTANFNQTPYALTSDLDDGRIPVKTQCAGNSLKLYSTYVSNNAAYKWYKDGVLMTSETGRILVVGSTGNYKVVPSDGSCYIESNGNREVAINFGNSLENYIRQPTDSLVCDAYVYLYTSGWAEGLSYQWLRNGVEISSAYQNFYSTNQEGVYSMRLRQGSCTSVSNAVRLYKSDKEQKPVISAPSAFASGLSYYISIRNPNNNLQWYKDGNLIQDAYNSNLKISTSGVYTVRKGYSDCAIDSDPIMADFGNSLSATILAQDSVRTLCNGNSATAVLYLDGRFFENFSSLSFRWTKDGVDLPSSNFYADKSYFYAYEDGVYRIRVSNGSSSGLSNPISVSSVSSRTVRLTVAESARSACEGNLTKLRFPQTSVNNPSLIWQRDGVTIPNQHQLELIALQSGSYTATYQGDGCTITTEPLPVIIGSEATSATLSGDYAIRTGETANLLISASAELNYFFKLSDGTEYTGQGATILIPKSPNLSTTYTLLSYGTHCGLGNASGTARIEVTKCAEGVVNYSLGSGFWDAPYLWSCGSVPTVLDPVRISSSHDVSLPNYISLKAKSLELQGNILYNQYYPNATIQIGK